MSVQDLQQELKKAKKAERLAYLQKELDILTKDYKGKCFGSDHFERANRSDYKGATYYEDFYIKDGILYVLEWYISCSKRPDFTKPSKFAISYNTNIYEKALSGEEGSHLNQYNPSRNLYSGYSFFRKEIPKEKFMILWEVGIEANKLIKEAFDGKLDIKSEWITEGDSSNENEIEDGYKKLKIECIDIQKEKPRLFEVIKYSRLPLFQNNRFLPIQFYNQVLELHIEKLNIDLKDLWLDARRASYIQREIKIIQEHLL